MAYDNEKLKFGKEKINIIEIDVDYCPLESGLTTGAGTCTAIETGDDKCFNTLETCNAISSYDAVMLPTAETKTYRFCESRSPHPIGLDAIPSLKSVSISPTKIDLKGGLGVRASISMTFNDHPSSGIGIDKYLSERTYNQWDRGSFWVNFRAQNPNYENRAVRALSGYLVDGTYDPLNFTTRYYIMDKLNATKGQATATAKDPLKLGSSKKSQAPKASTGLLSAGISNSDSSLTLTPIGVGDAEYPTSGKISINSEVISFTRFGSGDTLTLTGRAQNNTIATGHDANDTVQVCLEYIDRKVSYIAFKLLNEFAGIKIDLFDLDGWSAEVDAFLPGLLSGIITKPFDVFKLLIELSEAMPHYLWWDERLNLIRLTALKLPPVGSDTIGMKGNIIDDSFVTKDMPELRLSTVYFNFGQLDPTKEINETSNYQQTYVRVDTNSIKKYGIGEIKTINSRWITNTNAFAAQNAAKLIGRRFSGTPREVSFSLEDKDSDFWTGQTVNVNHRDIVSPSGAPIDTLFQIMTAKEGANFNYTALEFKYGDVLPGEPVDGVLQIPISGTQTNINLRTIYNSLGVTPDEDTEIVFYVENGTTIGSTSNLTYAVDTGLWPEIDGTGTGKLTLQIVASAFIVGRGGTGGSFNFAGADGGSALILNHNLTILNSGVVGGGGGGGGGASNSPLGGHYGGGGAGLDVGLGLSDASDGTLEFGGTPEPGAGKGGDLGQDGDDAEFPNGGSAGAAINKNGFTLLGTLGDIRGAVNS